MITIKPEYDPDLTKSSRVVEALAVIVLDPKIRAFLEENDPKALQQAVNALKKCGFKWPVPFGSEKDDLLHVCRSFWPEG